MTRHEAFASLEYHPAYAPLLRRLRAEERNLCAKFLRVHATDDTSDFGAAVNRMFLDVADKPKNKSVIQDLLTAANTIARGRPGRPTKFDGAMVRCDTRVPEGLRAFLLQEAGAKDRDLSEHIRMILIHYCEGLQNQGDEK